LLERERAEWPATKGFAEGESDSAVSATKNGEVPGTAEAAPRTISPFAPNEVDQSDIASIHPITQAGYPFLSFLELRDGWILMEVGCDSKGHVLFSRKEGEGKRLLVQVAGQGEWRNAICPIHLSKGPRRSRLIPAKGTGGCVQSQSHPVNPLGVRSKKRMSITAPEDENRSIAREKGERDKRKALYDSKLGNQDKTRWSKLQFCHQSKLRKHIPTTWMTTPTSNATPYLRNKMRDGYVARTPEQFGLRAFNIVLQIAIGYARLAHTIMRYS
jgi:hypothetical protein